MFSLSSNPLFLWGFAVKISASIRHAIMYNCMMSKLARVEFWSFCTTLLYSFCRRHQQNIRFLFWWLFVADILYDIHFECKNICRQIFQNKYTFLIFVMSTKTPKWVDYIAPFWTWIHSISPAFSRKGFPFFV